MRTRPGQAQATEEVTVGVLEITYKKGASGTKQIVLVREADFQELERLVVACRHATTGRSFRVRRYVVGSRSFLTENNACSVEPHKILEVKLTSRRTFVVRQIS